MDFLKYKRGGVSSYRKILNEKPSGGASSVSEGGIVGGWKAPWGRKGKRCSSAKRGTWCFIDKASQRAGSMAKIKGQGRKMLIASRGREVLHPGNHKFWKSFVVEGG